MTETLSPTATDPTDESTTQLHYVAIDQSYDAKQAARDHASERLTEELNEGGAFRRIVKSIWKGGAFKEYYEQKYTREALHEIESSGESGNVLRFQAGEQASKRARLATVERFTFETDEYLHAEAGENRETLDDESELSQEIKNLIRRNVEGELNDAAMQEERTRLLNAYQESHGGEMARRGAIRVDNLIDVANAVKGAIAHGESLDTVMQNMRISLGESRSGVRTEAHYNKVEKLADKLSQTRIGSLVQPETVVTAATLAASIARLGSHSLVGAATKTIAPGVAGGLWAALRENKRMKRDRQQHARERAQGKEYEAGSKRRDEMEETMYESRSAAELTRILNDRFGENASFDNEEAVKAAMDALADVELSIRTSDSRGVDLITYSSAGEVEEERLALDRARAQAKTTAQTQLEDPTVRSYLGLEDDATLQGMLDERINTMMSAMEGDMDQKDRAFNKLRRKHIAKAAAIGTLTGLVAGEIAQEGMAVLSDTRVGLVEQLWDAHNTTYHGTIHQTLLESLVHGDHDVSSHVTHVDPSSTYDSFNLGEHGHIALSSDMSMEMHDGLMTIKDHNGNILADHLTTNHKGNLTHESLARLREAHIAVSHTSHTVDLPPTHATEQVGLHEYLQAHHGDTTHVTRDFWYDNNTAQFDKNELQLDWGDHGDGINDHGSYQFSIAGMQPDGSSHDGHSVAWQEAARNGNLKLAISASTNSQNHVFMVDINPNGTVNIPKDSPAAEFFSNHDGHAVFDGKYAEVVQEAGKGHDGSTHIRPLATLVGTDQAHNGHYAITHEVAHTQYRPEYKLTSDGYDKAAEAPSTFTEMAPVIPIVPRRPLESMRLPDRRPTPDQIPPYYGYNGNYQLTPEQRAQEFSPSINRNPAADLELGSELSWFAAKLREREGDEYVARLEEAINNSPELRKIDPTIKTITTIPVAAANESDNIYGALSVYAQQDKEQLSRNVILLNVNWLDVAQNDPAKREKIDKTFAEIERARHDFPDLKIAVMTRQYNAERVKKTGGPIGYVAGDLMNTALYALHRGVENGNVASDSDVAIIRQDADMKGMSRHYLASLEKAMDRHPSVDIFNGTIRSDVRMQERYPGFGIVTNFSQSLRIAETAANKLHTVGINTVARASSLAAVGGLGMPHWSGAGSDDMQIGWRIGAARRGAKVNQEMGGYGYSAGDVGSTTEVDRRIVAQVPGMTVDSAADRLIPKYLEGKHYGAAWGGTSASGGTGFSDGPGGYRDRDADAKILTDNPRERISDGKIFKFIETNFTEELRGVNEESGKKVLAVFFGAVPGAYRVDSIGTSDVSFTLTAAGRRFLKNRIERESDGRFGSYGLRKMRQQYGIGGTRKPAHTESPLVPALT